MCVCALVYEWDCVIVTATAISIAIVCVYLFSTVFLSLFSSHPPTLALSLYPFRALPPLLSARNVSSLTRNDMLMT